MVASSAYESAIRLLARREHGAAELCAKLERKGFDADLACEAVAECQRLGLQSDHRFTESYTRWRIGQGYGPLKIIQELKNKRINSDLIQEILNQERHNWLGYAIDVWEKKSKGALDYSINDLQKTQRFLLYRGFSMDIINAVMKEITPKVYF